MALLMGVLQKHFQPASRKELYMAEFQVRRKQKDEDWVSRSFVTIYSSGGESYPNLVAKAQEVWSLTATSYSWMTEVTDKKLVGMEGSPLKVLGAVCFHVFDSKALETDWVLFAVAQKAITAKAD